MVSLTCVVPVYNEEAAKEVVSGLRKVLDKVAEYEIIVVDDGSTDVVKVEGATIVRHPQNMGYGASIKTGILKAGGDKILIVDADGTYQLEAIPSMLEGDYDMVVAARTKPNVNMPLYRRPAKWLIGQLANYLSGTPIPDLNSGLRVFRKARALEFLHLYPRGFSFTTTITLAFLCNDYTVKYVPIEYYRRKGKSKIRPVRDGLGFILLIVRTILYFNPLKVFLPVAALLFILGAAVFAYSAFALGRVMDITVIALITSAIEVALFGLLADLIVRRPR